MKNKNLLTTLAIAFVCLGTGFFAGTKYQPTKKTAFVNQFNQRGGRDQQGAGTSRSGAQTIGTGRAQGMRPVVGEITSSDGKTLTVKMPDGSSKIVMISSTTQINKAQVALVADLKTGEKVSVFGNTNPDGSVTAQNIQLNPLMSNQATPSATPKK